MFDDGSVTDRHFYYPFVGAPLACPANDRRAPRPAISRGSLAIAFQPRAYHIRA
jgi:hypothetical protein